jgi:hypothetical protein
MTPATQLPPRRFALRELVQVDYDGGTHIGVILAAEPGSGLREPVPGWVYHVRLPGHDSLAERVVIVAEGALRGLTEE